jgi:Pectate lyase superfamily protein
MDANSENNSYGVFSVRPTLGNKAQVGKKLHAREFRPRPFGLLFVSILLIGMVMGITDDSRAMNLKDLDASRRTDWTQAGYPGEIPAVNENVVIVTDHGVMGDGTKDDHDAIQALIDNAASPAVLYFPAGTYRIESALDLKSGIVFRGEGSNATHLDFFSDNGCMAIKGRTSGAFVSIQSGLQKGSCQIAVANASEFKAGEGGMIRQEDIEAVDPTGEWAGSGWVPEYVVGQMVRIVAVNGNTLTIDPPLNFSFSSEQHPEIQPVDYIQQVGIEDLHIKRLNTGTISNNLNIDYAADSWIKNVESDFTQKYHISISRSLRLEIRECYIHDALSKGDGGQGYGTSLSTYATAILVEDNIFNELRHSMIVQLGVNGCVFGYNYAQRNYSDDGWDKSYISVHGHYPYMNLFEGNIIGMVGIADYWGAAGPGNTLFRNRVMGTDKHEDFGLYRGITVDDYSHMQNIIGNELVGAQTQITFDGYTDRAQGTSRDLIVHGNNVHGTIEWDPAFPDHVLPASFYLSSKPAFWGAMQWPSLGGDMDPGAGSIPAKDRFDRGAYVPQPDGTSSDNSGGSGSSTPNTGGGTTGADAGAEVGASGGCFIGTIH